MGCSCRKGSGNTKPKKVRGGSSVRRVSEVLRVPVHKRLPNTNSSKGYIQSGDDK